MIPLFNIRGYAAPDPLDALQLRHRCALTSGVTLAVSAPLLFLVYDVLHIATLHPGWLVYVEILAAALLYAPVVLFLRKSSSLVQLAVLVVPFVALDIWLEAHCRAVGRVAPWMYDRDGLFGELQPLLRILIVWLGDALVMGSLALWLSRLIASGLQRGHPPSGPSRAREQALFPDEWCAEAPIVVRLGFSGWVLRGVGLAYLSYVTLLLVGLLGPATFPEAVRPLLELSFQNPALGIHTLIKIALITDLAFLGAFNPELRFHTGAVLLGAHLVSTAAALGFWALAPTNDPERTFLLLSALADAVMAVFLGWVVHHHRALASRYALPREFPEFFSVPQRLARLFWRAHTLLCALILLGILASRFLADPQRGWGAVFGYPDPLVSNVLTQYTTLGLIGFLVCRREALRERLVAPVVKAFVISALASLLWLLLSEARVRTRTGGDADIQWYFALSVATGGLLAGLLLWLRRAYYDVDHGIVALSPSAAQHVLALHEALFEQPSELPAPKLAAQVVQAIDRHVGGIRGRKRGLLNLPFALLEVAVVGVYGVRPRFSGLAPDQRRAWLRRYVLRPPAERRRAFIPPLAEAIYRLGSAAHAFVSWAHFDQLGGRGAIGYVPPGARSRLQGRYATHPPPSLHPVAPPPRSPKDPENFAPPDPPGALPLIAPRVVTPATEAGLPAQVDYLIIGSGAGAGVMAYRLATSVARPDRILVVERGPRLSPPGDFTASEMSQIRQLYKEGGLQQTKRFDLVVLQGECVGGSTVINNGICARMPPAVRKLWREQYGVPLDNLDAEYQAVAGELGIGTIDAAGVNQRVSALFQRGTEPLVQAGALSRIDLLSNHRNLLGTGLDNLGDQHLRKRSMLETYLSWAEGLGVRIVSEVTGVRFTGDPRKRHADSVLLRTSLGGLTRVRVNKAVIVAGGVIASSHFLMRSGVAGSVGSNVACNFALPAVLEFDEEVHAYDGLQITLGALDVENRAIFETYFNPPGAFALSIPFFFERYQALMRRYVHQLNFGALVGADPGGTVERKADVLNGRAISWQLTPRDVGCIEFALRTLADLARHAGARRITLRTEPGISFEPTLHNCQRFARALAGYPLKLSDLALVTAHPQGGNRLAAGGAPQAGTAVVNEHFRLRAWDNVYVADASIFPTGITVNPQWTILALASLAARCVLQEQEPVAPLVAAGAPSFRAAE